MAKPLGELAVVYDPNGDFAKHFFTEARNDRHLNPTHVGCPQWRIGHEWKWREETAAMAESMYPYKPGEAKNFFTDAARTIFAYLLEFQPRTQDLVEWLGNKTLILDHIRKAKLDVHQSAIENIMSDDAPAQSAGVMGSLNLAAAGLALCPKNDLYGTWTAREWAEDPEAGWLFISNTPATRPILVPLQSMMIDQIILRLMGRQRGSRNIKLIVDELASMNRIPQMATVLAEGRKHGISVVIGYQDDSQLEQRYGIEARAMVAQPYTKFFLGQNNSGSAKHASDTIGQVEIERIEISRSSSGFGKTTRSEALRRSREPLVMDSEISGLRPMRGYLKYGGMVTHVQFTYNTLDMRCEGIVERTPDGPRLMREEPAAEQAVPENSLPFDPPPSKPDAVIDGTKFVTTGTLGELVNVETGEVTTDGR